MSKSDIVEAFFESYTNFISFWWKFFRHLRERCHSIPPSYLPQKFSFSMLALKGFLHKVKHWFSSPFPGYSTTKSVHESLKLKKKYAKRLAKRLLFMTNSTFPNFPSDPASPLTHFRICPRPRASIDDFLSATSPQVYTKSANNCGTQKRGSNKKSKKNGHNLPQDNLRVSRERGWRF